ncbi:hypothetical protein [Photobacterium sp.]|uniref:hypothetical protein n=1 Tax=Photobacterium sp. TaxID=660 RepID=UPI00299E14E9|nr:hypothetical protein [Photobacterium sp.]MDX1303038.1 hypothetical protein [Photobacterium sp.]
MLKKYYFILFAFCSFHVTAQPGHWMPTAKKISGIVVEGIETSGKALIIIDEGVPDRFIPAECKSPYNTVDLTTEKGRGILSVALSARMADKPVKLALSCIGARPLITHIWL